MRVLFSFLLILFACKGKGENAGTYYTQGGELFKAGKYDEAISQYEKGIKLAKNKVEKATGYNLMGMAYRFRFNTTHEDTWRKEEISSFKKAIETDSLFWPALINLGATYYYSGQKKEGAVLFEKALKIFPQHPERDSLRAIIERVKEEK